MAEVAPVTTMTEEVGSRTRLRQEGGTANGRAEAVLKEDQAIVIDTMIVPNEKTRGLMVLEDLRIVTRNPGPVSQGKVEIHRTSVMTVAAMIIQVFAVALGTMVISAILTEDHHHGNTKGVCQIGICQTKAAVPMTPEEAVEAWDSKTIRIASLPIELQAEAARAQISRNHLE
jgi:hypothetical protein